MTLLAICQNAATEVGFPAPSSIIGNADITAKQLLRFAKKEGDMISRHNWQVLIKEGLITLSTSDQDYALPSDFRYIIPVSTWNRSDRRIVINPITSQEWQYLKGWTNINGLNLRARIRNNQLEFEQTITSSDNNKTIYFEYVSKNWAQSESGTLKSTFTADQDSALIDEEIITLGVVWRFAKSKGLDWQEDYGEYETRRMEAIGRDKGSRKLDMSGRRYGKIGVNITDRDFG